MSSPLQRFRLHGNPFINAATDGEDATFSDEVYGTLELERHGTDSIIFRNAAGTTTVLRGYEIKVLLLLLTGYDASPRSMLGPGHVPPEQPYRPSTREEQLQEMVKTEVAKALREGNEGSDQ